METISFQERPQRKGKFPDAIMRTNSFRGSRLLKNWIKSHLKREIPQKNAVQDDTRETTNELSPYPSVSQWTTEELNAWSRKFRLVLSRMNGKTEQDKYEDAFDACEAELLH